MFSFLHYSLKQFSNFAQCKRTKHTMKLERERKSERAWHAEYCADVWVNLFLLSFDQLYVCVNRFVHVLRITLKLNERNMMWEFYSRNSRQLEWNFRVHMWYDMSWWFWTTFVQVSFGSTWLILYRAITNWISRVSMLAYWRDTIYQPFIIILIDSL